MTMTTTVPPRCERIVDDVYARYRTYGYDGTTPERVAEATGLPRPDLDRLFPGGAPEMAGVALDRLARFASEELLALFAWPATPKERLLRMMAALERHYDGGRESCLLGVFATGVAHERFAGRVNAIAQSIITAFERIAADSGLGRNLSRRRAVDAFVAIQGALAVAHMLEETSAFERAIGDLPERLLVG